MAKVIVTDEPILQEAITTAFESVEGEKITGAYVVLMLDSGETITSYNQVNANQMYIIGGRALRNAARLEEADYEKENL